MINTLLGIKKGMTSTYDSRGRRVGATILRVSPNYITQIKTPETKDGYSAIQIGMGTKKSVKQAQIGHAKKSGLLDSPRGEAGKKIRWFREIRIKNEESRIMEDIKPGTEVTVNQVFSIGDALKVTGVSKGKGFQGGVKRYNFRGGPKTHGQSDRHRAPGSIGAGTTPGRVYKGKRMAGHMGVERVSYMGMEVVGIDKLKNMLIVKGGIPGPIGGMVILEKQGRIKGYTPPPEEKLDESEDESILSEAKDLKESQEFKDSSAVPQNDNKEEAKAETPGEVKENAS